jgi:murein DD-endopeptidase MepM/ murein hydrolase activator NlpD
MTRSHKLPLILIVLLGVFASPVFAQPQSGPPAETIRARSGDTLATIAQRLGLEVTQLEQLNGINGEARLKRGQRVVLPSPRSEPSPKTDVKIVGNRITLADGYSFEADEVWKEGDDIWYRKGSISHSLQREVKSVVPLTKPVDPPAATTQPPAAATNVVPSSVPIWIYLNGGARVRVDEVTETNDGAWFRRGNLSMFLERERIARIERNAPGTEVDRWQARDWTTGNARLDDLIKTNGARFGVDPYLVFCVIEQESQFKAHAVSPKGARGLMQLMPATARRLGVRRSFDPAENIMGGTRYLKELMSMFGGRVDLVLASYNAGEGAVLKYGRNVPPYRETRDYVRKISKRYGDQKDSTNQRKGPNTNPVQ